MVLATFIYIFFRCAGGVKRRLFIDWTIFTRLSGMRRILRMEFFENRRSGTFTDI